MFLCFLLLTASATDYKVQAGGLPAEMNVRQSLVQHAAVAEATVVMAPELEPAAATAGDGSGIVHDPSETNIHQTGETVLDRLKMLFSTTQNWMSITALGVAFIACLMVLPGIKMILLLLGLLLLQILVVCVIMSGPQPQTELGVKLPLWGLSLLTFNLWLGVAIVGGFVKEPFATTWQKVSYCVCLFVGLAYDVFYVIFVTTHDWEHLRSDIPLEAMVIAVPAALVFGGLAYFILHKFTYDGKNISGDGTKEEEAGLISEDAPPSGE